MESGKFYLKMEKTFYEVTESVEPCPGKEVCKIGLHRVSPMCLFVHSRLSRSHHIMSTICKYVQFVKSSILHDHSQMTTGTRAWIGHNKKLKTS